jgi:hypothetical protein
VCRAALMGRVCDEQSLIAMAVPKESLYVPPPNDVPSKVGIFESNRYTNTLTPLKTAMLLKGNDSIHNWVFVVDRKDLDRQTHEGWSGSNDTSFEGEARLAIVGSANQFNSFREGCVVEKTNTAAFFQP